MVQKTWRKKGDRKWKQQQLDGGMERDFFSNGKYGTVGVEQNANNAQFSWGGIPLMQSQCI